MYTPKWFRPDEFVPRDYVAYWRILMDERVLITLDQMREFFGVPIIVNTAAMQYRGFRPHSWIEEQIRAGNRVATMSQHLFGRAADCTVQGLAAEYARQQILANRKKFPYLTVMERDVSWLHFDVRNTESTDIILVNG